MTGRIPDSNGATHLERSGCRLCQAPLKHTFVDLGMSPLCQSFLGPEQLDAMEPFYPLQAYICGRCLK